MTRNKLKIVLPIVVLVAGVAAAVLLASARKAPERTERVSLGPLVEVVEVVQQDVPVVVAGHGQVGAKVAVDVVPQVGGRVVAVAPAIVAGGFFRAGQALVVVEPRDYELAVERAMAAVARTEVVLEQQRAEAEVAREEWDALHPGESPPSGLVVREPQVRQAEAELAAAEADLDVARLNLERTRISLPFDGVVVSENVDQGQYIVSGQPIARVYGTDAVEIRLPLENRELEWFAVPGAADSPSPRAEVEADYAGNTHTWQGRVTRMEAEVDPSSRMVNVVVEVRDPFDRSGTRPPLMPGTFVDVRVFGRTVTGLMPIPRYAVHEGNQVWVAEDGVLRIRRVEVARSDREVAYISDGLSDGDRVVVTVLDAVTDGMKIRTAGTADAEESGLDDAGNETVAYLDVGYRTLDSGSRSSRSDALGWDDGWPTLRVRHPASSIQHPASWRVGVPA
jgi:RND family efflux transporter MFP subunit